MRGLQHRAGCSGDNVVESVLPGGVEQRCTECGKAALIGRPTGGDET